MNRTARRTPSRLAWPLLVGAVATALAGCQTMPTQPGQASAPASSPAPLPGAAANCQWLVGGTTPVEAGAAGGLLGALVGAAGAKATGGGRVAVRNTALIAGLATGFIAALQATQSQHRGQLTAAREPDGSVKISMPGSLLFGFDSAAVKPELNSTLQSLAQEINKYCDVGVKVVGHTDDVGKPDYNLTLSQKRADAIAASLRGVGVLRAIQTEGAGANRPAVPNSSEANRSSNRRVELFVVPPPGA